ncbi:HAD family phosphatase [Sphingorhabdus sp. Alg239-R122]|uniref:HAD family hydrolase n=1 Tax=Sphingorhabdus sp. Alg239-R122 TaxID=2305989 RepID=UPI0013D92AA9|nr:HAD family phosphatase [Sphingorhabdus sp. Alg239-R122]
MPSATPIDTVIFDVGNVLYRWEIRALYEKLIDDAQELEWFLEHVITTKWHFQHDAGRPFAETSRELSAQHPEYADLITQFGPRFNETVPGPVPGMEELVVKLAHKNVPLYAITNFSDEFWGPFAADRQHIFSHFQDILVSGTEKLVKPDAAIYELAIRRFGIDPACALFIDDRLDNVEGARACGLNTHLFQDANLLQANLVSENLL